MKDLRLNIQSALDNLPTSTKTFWKGLKKNGSQTFGRESEQHYNDSILLPSMKGIYLFEFTQTGFPSQKLETAG